MKWFSKFRRREADNDAKIESGPGVWMFPKSKVRDEDGFYPIVCPHCYGTFHIWEAEFRNCGFDDESDLNGVGENFPMEIDQKYEELTYEGNRPRGKVLRIFDENGEPTGEVTHIVFMDPKDGGYDNNNPRVSLKGHSEKDFRKKPILHVINKYGFLCDERICPHCHHMVSDYVGIWPSYSIAITSDKQAGKNAYLNRLTTEITGNGLLGGILSGLEIIEKPVVPLIQIETWDNVDELSRSTSDYLPPYIMNVFNKSVSGDHADGFILNLLAVSTESLITKKKLYEENVDAWMHLADPARFMLLEKGTKKDDLLKKFHSIAPDKQPEELYDYLTNGYPGALKNAPIAFIISKSDMIRFDDRYLDNNILLFLNPNKKNKQGKVDLDDICICAEQIEAFAMGSASGASFYERCCAIKGNKENTCWFAVSSFGNQDLGQWAEPVRITEPLEWILWRLGLVAGIGENIPGGGEPIKV